MFCEQLEETCYVFNKNQQFTYKTGIINRSSINSINRLHSAV